MTSIAILLTCYNRKATTLRCLASLAMTVPPAGFTVKTYLVDDASPDGTGESVTNQFPEIRLLKGDGNLYWGGGMRFAFGEAMRDGHDFYLWLNDDADLLPDSLVRLVETYRRVIGQDGNPAIIVGACYDPQTGRMVYSGQKRVGWHPLRYERIEPDVKEAIACETMNGNVVLISSAAAMRQGNIDARFIHQMGDLDYGLRAHRQHIPIWVAPGFVARCRPNPRAIKWKSPDLKFSERLKLVNTPLGLPASQWLAFSWRHGGFLGLLTGLFGYRGLLLPKRTSASL